MVTVTVLVATEFRYFLCACYYVTPPNLQRNFDGRGTSFDVRHALSCIKVGLLITSHNEVCEKLLYISWWALPSASLRVKHFIRQGRIRSEGGTRQGSDILDTRGGVIIRGLWYRQTNTIINIKTGDNDTDTYKFDPMNKIVARW